MWSYSAQLLDLRNQLGFRLTRHVDYPADLSPVGGENR